MGSLLWIVVGAVVLLRMLIRDWSGVTAKEEGAKQRELDMWGIIGFFVAVFFILSGIFWIASSFGDDAVDLAGIVIQGAMIAFGAYCVISNHMEQKSGKAGERMWKEYCEQKAQEKRIAELTAKKNGSEEDAK